jgi:hypothetical protein
MRTLTLAVLAFAQAFAGSPAAASACSGADPAITSVVVKSVTNDGGINRYHLSGIVVNAGRQKQASNVLQFVDIFSGGDRLDAIGIPPLKPGQSYTFGWTFQRSQDAGDDTTMLRFQIRMRQPTTFGPQNCSLANDRFVLRF